MGRINHVLPMAQCHIFIIILSTSYYNFPHLIIPLLDSELLVSGSNFLSHTQHVISFLKNRGHLWKVYIKNRMEYIFLSHNSLFKLQSNLIAVLVALICMLGLPTDGHVILPGMSGREGLSLLSSKFMSDVDTSLYIFKYVISSHKNLLVRLYLLCFIDEEARAHTS